MIAILILAMAGNGYADKKRQPGEHARRVAAEILVIAGDARKLASKSSGPVPQWRTGLKKRILGGLSGLAILLRLADEETGQASNQRDELIKRLRSEFDRKQMKPFLIRLDKLAVRYPLPTLPSQSDAKMAKGLHLEYCAGCHDDPVRDTERPAFSLFQQAQNQPPREFLARLIVGVRGDRTTGFGNPLNDRELAALVNYYKNDQP